MTISTPPTRPSSGSGLTIALAIVGGLALAGTGTTAAIAAANDITRTDTTQRAAVDGIETLKLRTDAGDVRLAFGDVDDAELTVRHGRDGWSMRRDGDALVVNSPDGWRSWWFGAWNDDQGTAVLTLPRELEGIDATLAVSAGSLDVGGVFGALEVDLSAGDLAVDAQADTLSTSVSAGSADLRLDGVRTAALDMSAGDVALELDGEAPERVTVDVSAGSADLRLPDAEYALFREATAGDIEDSLRTSPDAASFIEVRVTAGSVTLNPVQSAG